MFMVRTVWQFDLCCYGWLPLSEAGDRILGDFALLLACWVSDCRPWVAKGLIRGDVESRVFAVSYCIWCD